MGIFGWSYPPGCSGPPDDDAVLQITDYAPKGADMTRLDIFWLEEGGLVMRVYPVRTAEPRLDDDGYPLDIDDWHDVTLGQCDWNESLTEEENSTAAAAVAVRRYEADSSAREQFDAQQEDRRAK